MQAILLTKENRDKVLEVTPNISGPELDDMIEEYGEHSLGDQLIFIPKFEEVPNQGPRPPYSGWATVPMTGFEEFFETTEDVEKMKTDFITITHKPSG